MTTMMFKLMISIMLMVTIISFQASAGCGRWVVRENSNVDYLADPVFDAAFNDPVINPYEKSNEVANADVSNNTSQPLQEDKKLADLSGKWQINMGKSEDYLRLILIQSDDRLQGYGNLIDNTTEIPATATGSVSKNTVNLDTKLVVDGTLNKADRKYKIDLASSRKTMSGSYELYEANKLIREGNATAIRILT
ncbi:MAG: hypothetical protein LUQ38_07540 [Methanotrichaceae archaeon]|nr:hypothetical protein [Methanotrichaceae archaeon]